MKLRLLPAILFSWIAISRVMAQDPGQSFISAQITTYPTNLYVGQVFQTILTIQSSGVQMSRNMNITPFGEGLIQRISASSEMAPNHRAENGAVILTQTFVWNTIALSNGTASCSPVLTVGLYTRRPGSFFSSLEEKEHHVTIPSFAITVQPLPARDRPANFSGAVGQFDFQAIPSHTNVIVNDVCKLLYTVTGTGNLSAVQLPVLSSSSQFKAYEAKQADTTSPHMRSAEQFVVPLSTNATSIPALSFCYFDPLAQSYRTITRGPFPLHFVPQIMEVTERFHPDNTETRPAALSSTQSTPQNAPAFSLSTIRLLLAFSSAVLLVSIGGIITARIKRTSMRLFAWAGAIFLLLTAGLVFLSATQNRDSITRGILVLPARQSAFLAPSPHSRVNFELPAEARVRVISQQGTWLKIESNKRRGWIKQPG